MSRLTPIERVAVFLEDEPDDVIYIRPRMDLGTNALVRSAMMSIKAQAGAQRDAQGATISVDWPAYNLALLVHNILDWKGPGFEGLPCTADTIKRIDPDDKLMEKVLEEINERNKPKAQSPNASSANGKKDLMPNGAPKKQEEKALASVQ